MALKDTIKHLRDLLTNITADLEKADGGNKAASQRVRTGTVRLEKVAKHYRKESIKHEKTATKSPRKSSAKKAARPAAKKAAKPAAKKAVKAKSKAKHAHRPHALSFKRPSAKIPARKAMR